MFKSSRAKETASGEAAALLAATIPLVMAQAHTIREGLTCGARQAARELAAQYSDNPAIVTSRSLANARVFDNVRVHGIVNASAQFSDPVWDTAGSPPTVSVTVTYTSNQNGLPSFPSPDLLDLGSDFVIRASSTYPLE
jgi:hypothetical protein